MLIKHKKLFKGIGFILLTLMILISTEACKESFATVDCKDIERFQSRIGILNVPVFRIGDLVRLDAAEKTGNSYLSIDVSDSDMISSEPIDSTVLLTKTSFNISLAGDVSEAGEDVKAEIKNQISDNTTFFLSHYFRKNIKNPFSLIESDKSIIETLVRGQDNNTIYMLIGGIVFADKFEFRTRNNTGLSVEANILTVGDFTLNVEYKCEGSAIINAKQGGIFFKPFFFKIADKKVIPQGDLDISDYRLVSAK